MADFSLSSASYVRPFKSPWGSFPIRTLPASTGLSSAGAISVGQVVTLDYRGVSTSFHKVYGSTASGGFGTVSTMGAVVGIAGSSASASTDHNKAITIFDANPNVEFRAVTKGATLLSSLVGSARTLSWDSSLSIHYVDVGASTAADNRVLVTQLIDAVGDSGGQVAFKFMRQPLGSTSNSSAAWLAFSV